MKNFAFFLSLLILFTVTSAPAATQDFKSWLKDVRAEAARDHGISQAVIKRALPDTLKPIERILELDRKQPEGTVTFDEYLARTVTNDRVEKGRTQMLQNRRVLKEVEQAFGVDANFIVALWGIETSYGRVTGGYDVVNALATLAYDGRRSDYFRGELFKALQILEEEHISHTDMKGSWAGAMGQSQFMPSSFLRYAVDFNKDGKRDIWKSQPDVFASAANYLAENGWKRGAAWGRKVHVPETLDRQLLGVNSAYSLQFWHDKGVRLTDGKSAVPFEGEYMVSIVQPSGPGTTAYVIYDNFRVLLKWNKSSYFATAVSTLADRIK